MLTPESTVRAASGQVSATIGEKTVILSLANGTCYSLNEVGTWVWSQLQSGSTVRRLHGLCLSTYEVDAAACEAVLLALLSDLAAAGLSEVA